MTPYSPTPLLDRAEEVQELITRIPSWLLRWGTILISLLLLGLLLLSWIIRYPELVPASFQLSSINAPKSLFTRTDGKLTGLLVHEGQSVRMGQVLAYVESTAQYGDVSRLEGELARDSQWLSTGQLEAVGQRPRPPYPHLGELQAAYQTYSQSVIELRAYLFRRFYAQKRILLVQELADLEQLANNLRTQQQLQAQDNHLAQDEYEVQRRLAMQKVISPLELMQHESKKLARLLPFQLTQALLIQNSMAQRAKQKEIMELDRQVSEYRVTFSQRLNSLRSSVEAWKSRYLVIAPMSGQVHFRSYLQVNQYVANRQELLVIAPASTAYFGELHVPQVNFGKVKLGQRVIIKFAGYPYEQYGSVSGRIAALSDVPASDHTFLAKVSLPDGLQTNYHKQITYRPGLVAQGEIVTEDTRLVERLLYSLRKATNP